MDNIKNYEITVFGDSISKGIVTDKEGKITKIGDGIVDIIENYYGIHINNISFYGQTLKKMYTRGIFEKYIEDSKNKKSIAVLFIGGNDADYDWRCVSEAPYKFHDSKSSVQEFGNMYGDILNKLQEADIIVATITIPPIDSERYFNNVIGKVADKQKVLEFFSGDITNIERHQECYNISIMKTSAKYNVPCFDLRTPLLLKRDLTDYLCLDGIHPNEKGHKFMAETLIKYLDEEDIG